MTVLICFRCGAASCRRLSRVIAKRNWRDRKGARQEIWFFRREEPHNRPKQRESPEPLSLPIESTERKSPEISSLVSDSRFSGDDISSDHIQVVAGGFERLLGIMVRHKSGVIIKSCIALPAETIKDDQQPSMFLVDARTHEVDNSDVVPRLTSRTESMAEHESQGSFEHRS